MSRGQQQQVLNTATGNSATDQGNATSSYGGTEGAIGDYDKQLQSFVSGNPFASNGEYSKTINTGLANTSDAGANSLGGALQSQSWRTGQNSAAGLATAKSGAQQNTRDLSSALASSQQNRINSEAGYNTTALNAGTVPIGANQALYGTSVGAANSALGTAQNAAQTPSFWDTLGDSFASIPGNVASGVGQGLGKAIGTCWIASELWGGWDDPRTILVRTWLQTEFSQHRFGRIVVALYMRFGERMAKAIRRHPWLRRVFLPIFNAALLRARGK